MVNGKAEKTDWHIAMYTAVFIICLFLLPPEGLSSIVPRLYSLLYYGRFIAYLFILIMFIGDQKNNGADDCLDFFFLSIIVITCILTVIKKGSIGEWFNIYGSMTFLLMLISWLRERIPELLKTLNAYLIMIIILNLFCLIRWPGGMYVTDKTRYTQNWLFGYKSSFQYYLFPCAFITWLEYEYKRLSLSKLALIISLCIYESIVAGNAMLTVTLFCFAILAVFRLDKVVLRFNSLFYLFTIIIANIVAVFYTTLVLTSSLGSAFLLFLNKDDSLGGRASRIWPYALRSISKSPWFGYGVQDADTHRELYRMNSAIHAHNQFLELAYTGGVVLLLIFIIWLFFKFGRTNDHSIPSSKVISISMFMIFLMTTVEVFSRGIGIGFWLILFLSNYVYEIDRQYVGIIDYQ